MLLAVCSIETGGVFLCFRVPEAMLVEMLNFFAFFGAFPTFFQSIAGKGKILYLCTRKLLDAP